MKKLLPLFVLLVTTAVSYAQVAPKKCGTFDLMQYREQQTPGYLARVNACFDNAKQVAQANKNNRAADDTIYRIRTVFHVVQTAAEEDIPDSVIYSQIEVLNEDYRRLNADTVLTRDVFKPVAGDARMEFYLATTDPDGNPTTGITRTVGTPGILGFEPFTDNVKSSATGGKNPWPTDRYLNVWVCNVFFGIGVLGYAFPPSNAPNWPNGSTTDSAKQGVVLHFPVVGRNFSAPIDPTVDMGRSLVHELGHYFGLRHIWGDSTECNNNDGMDDTPAALDAHQQTCDTIINSCVDSPVDFPDMIENYMDYSDDRCLNMFTHEQIGMMRAMLQTSRAGIATAVIETAIEETETNFETIRLFPIPSSGEMQLAVQVKDNADYNLEILNAVGDKLISIQGLSGSNHYRTVDLSAQPSGIYFAKFYSGSETVMKKFSLVK